MGSGLFSHADGASAHPTATVVVCTRDRPALLAEALTALRAAADDAEIVVVDSASITSETRDAARAAGVRYVRSDVPGLSIARNLGLAEATGDVVVYTDDDCLVDEGFLAPLLAPFAEPTVGAATGRLRDAADSVAAVAPRVSVLRAVTDGLDAGHGALMAFRRDTLSTLGGFDPVLGAGRRFGGAEDMDALCRVLAAGSVVARVPASVVTHVYTRTDDDYERLNFGYGLGIGAMCCKWLRESPGDGRALTAVVWRRALTRYARRAGSARTRRGQGAYVRGLFRGMAEARRVRASRNIFVDEHPPTAIAGVVSA